MKTEIEKLRAIGDALREVELPRASHAGEYIWLKETMGKAITLVDEIRGRLMFKEWYAEKKKNEN